MPRPPRRDTNYVPLSRRLAELDAELSDLLARRSQLLASLLARQQDRGQGASTPRLLVEKELWRVWETHLKAGTLDPAVWRQIFTLANSLGFELAAGGKARNQNGFTLAPRREPVDLDLQGPVDRLASRLAAFLAGASGEPASLDPVVVNDPLFELAKAMNGLGAGFNWTPTTLDKPRTTRPATENVSIFCGRDRLNLFLLLGLALAAPSRSRFSGASELKLLNLGPTAKLLVKLGARLSPLDPKSSGLPFRLESGGPQAALLDLAGAEAVPVELIQGLALSGWAHPDGLTLTWEAEAPAWGELTHALLPVERTLQAWGVKALLSPGRMAVERGAPRAPQALDLPLDEELSSFLLALPAALGGRTRLAGTWPGPEAESCGLALLRAAGLEVEMGPGYVESRSLAGPGEKTRHIRLDPGACPHYLPRALARALARTLASASAWPEALAAGLALAQADEAEVGVRSGSGEADLAEMIDLVQAAGRRFMVEPGTLAIGPVAPRPRAGAPYRDRHRTGPAAPSRPAAPPRPSGPAGRPGVGRDQDESSDEPAWFSPGLSWGLALTLAAALSPGLVLANPGTISSEWPGFWTIYNNLPQGRERAKPDEDEGDKPGHERRRIRIE